MYIEGKLVKILRQETGISKVGKEWKKQSILIEQDTKHNKDVVISFFGDNINKIKSIKIGDIISCNVNISSREYNGKWYHNIDGWTCNMSDTKHLINETEGEINNDLPF